MRQTELETRDHPATVVVSWFPSSSAHIQLFFSSCVHKRVCGIFTHLNLS